MKVIKMMYKKYLMFAALVSLVTLNVSCKDVVVEVEEAFQTSAKAKDSGKITGPGKYSFADFDEIEVNGASNIRLKQSDDFGFELKGDPDAIQRLEISQVGKRLIIDEKSDWFDNLSEGKCEITISMPMLKKYHLSGANRTRMVSVFKQAHPLELDIAGAGSMNLNLDVPELIIDASGASSLKLQGVATKFNIDMAGAGSIDGLALKTDSAIVETSGAGSVSLAVAKHLTVDASGVGTVRYKGNPQIDQDISGMANVKQVSE